eukprot:EG_transcript_35012
MLRCAVALLTLALLCVGHGAPSCAENGFTDGLVCSSCETLKEIVKDEALYTECKACCTDDTRQAVYKAGQLVVCRCKLPSHPHIQTFIDKKAAAYPHLKVVLTQDGAYPQLWMETTAGGREVVAIERWKTEQVEEFLTAHLPPAPTL